MKRTIRIACPNCGSENDFVMWESVNTKDDPSMRSAVRDGSAFLFTCPSCGGTAVIDHDVIYHQQEDRIMIRYVNSEEGTMEAYEMLTGAAKDTTGIVGRMRREKYLLRLVRSQDELREKLRIFDAGLDDRIVEIFKWIVRLALEKQGTSADGLQLTFVREGEAGKIVIFSEGNAVGETGLPRELYESLRKDYGSRLKDIREDDPLIDGRWADGFLRK